MWNIYQIIDSVFYVLIKLYATNFKILLTKPESKKKKSSYLLSFVHPLQYLNVYCTCEDFRWKWISLIQLLNFLNDCTRLFTCKASTFFNRFSDSRLFSSVIPLFSIMTIYLSLLNNLITISFGHLNKHLSRKCHFL